MLAGFFGSGYLIESELEKPRSTLGPICSHRSLTANTPQGIPPQRIQRIPDSRHGLHPRTFANGGSRLFRAARARTGAHQP